MSLAFKRRPADFPRANRWTLLRCQSKNMIGWEMENTMLIIYEVYKEKRLKLDLLTGDKL